MKLLLIEDDVHVAKVLAEAFGADGHETTVMHSGEEGLAYLTRERPDAVVLDVRLPALNGVAVLRKIRSTDPGLPVIIMTGLATVGEIERRHLRRVVGLFCALERLAVHLVQVFQNAFAGA